MLMRNVLFGMILLLSAAAACGDTITVNRKEHEGEFERFENGRFTFNIPFGETLEFPASSVSELKLDQPCSVSVESSAGSVADNLTLFRFWRAAFDFEHNGVKKSAYAMKVKRILVRKQKAETRQTRPVSSDIAFPREFADISKLEHRTDLPSRQTAALKDYVVARDHYKAFFVESSRLVSAMDSATGDRRLEILTALRTRKNDEQPILQALDQAEEILLAAFPPPAE